VSYAGENWEVARRLARRLEDEGVDVFCVTSPGALEVFEEAPVEQLLRLAFAQARIAVFVLASGTSRSKWIQIERRASHASAEQTLFMRPRKNLRWPRSVPQKNRFEHDLGGEVALTRRVRQLLRRAP
jgi:hypothetical protein